MSQSYSPPASDAGDDPEDCVAEFIDGSWDTTWCPCVDCVEDTERQDEERDAYGQHEWF